MIKNFVSQLESCKPGDLVCCKWTAASIGKTSTNGGVIDVPVRSWGLFVGVFGKRKHIILAQNSFEYADGQRSVVAVVIQSQSVKWLGSMVQVVNKQMRFWHYKKSSLASLLSIAIIVILSRACYESVMQVVNKQRSIWNNKKGGLAGWLWYAIVVVVLVIVLILALRFLFGII